MVQILKIDEKSSVAGQITVADIQEAARHGVTLIINNRPDGESFGQPKSKDLAAEAARLGISFVNLTFSIPAQITPDMAAEFARHFRNTDGAVLAYCRSGLRSILLWGAAMAALGVPTAEIITKAGRAGFDLSRAAGFLEDLGRAAVMVG